MEILKNLSEKELDELRDAFETHKQHSLSRKEFRRVLRAASAGKELPFKITKSYLNHLFSSVDVTGEERVAWTDFSMYVVEQSRTSAEITVPYKEQLLTRQRPHSSSTQVESSSSTSDEDEELLSCRPMELSPSAPSDRRGGTAMMEDLGSVRRYHVDSLTVNPLGARMLDMRLLPRTTRLLRVTENLKGQRTLTLHEDAENFPVLGLLPRRLEPLAAWEFIPSTGGVTCSCSIASAYQNGLVQLYSLPNAGACEHTSEFLNCIKTLHTPDTQTALQWSTLYGRLVMGSANGIVSVWDVDTDRLATQERLHTLPIMSCRLRTSMLYSASLDRFDSVKATDLEKSVVLYSFSDHLLGGALHLQVDNEYIITSGCESKLVLRAVQAPNATFTHLYDGVTPHQGRISAIHRIPSTPLLISGDSKGNLKIWDLRMNSCLQTFPSTTLGYTKKTHFKKSTKKGTDGSGEGSGPSIIEKDREEDTAEVLSICPLPKLGLIHVGTASHRYTLTALEAAFPDRVDDDIPCRFVCVPNASQLITVHGSYFKLWNVTSGHPIYTSSPKAVHGDITSVALVEPLKRQFLCGSITGDLKCFTVPLGKRTFNFYPALRDSEFIKRDNPIISLDTIPNFRDQPMPYVIVTYKDSVVILPVAQGVRTTSIIRLHVVNNLLDDNTHTIKETRFKERQLFVSLSNNTVHLVDLHFNTVTAMYQLPTHNLDNIHVAILTEGSYHRVEQSFASKRRMHSTVVQSFFLAADGNGNIMCGKGVQLNNLEEVQQHRTLTRPLLGLWNAGQEDSWKGGWRGRPGRRRRSQSIAVEKDDVEPRESFLPHIPADASPAVTHLYFFSLFCCLVTGDERGNIKLWDMTGVFSSGNPLNDHESEVKAGTSMSPLARMTASRRSPTTPSGSGMRPSQSRISFSEQAEGGGGEMPDHSSPPVLINAWHAHSQGFTCLEGIDHPHLMLPVVVTGGPDHHLLMWSGDGYPIGSFATGRPIDDTSGGRRFGLLPYLFQPSPDGNSSKWDKFLNYYRRRTAQEKASPLNREALHHPLSEEATFTALNPERGATADRGFSVSLGEMRSPISRRRTPCLSAVDETMYATEPLMRMPHLTHLEPQHFTGRRGTVDELSSSMCPPLLLPLLETNSKTRRRKESAKDPVAGSDECPFASTPSDWMKGTSGSPRSRSDSIQSSTLHNADDIIKPQYRLTKLSRPKIFQLARTGAYVKGTVMRDNGPAPLPPSHRSPQRRLTGRRWGEAAHPGVKLPPLSAPVPVKNTASHEQPLEFGNGVLEVRVRQQSILHLDMSPRIKPKPFPEVSPRMIEEEYDVKVNVHGRVVEINRRNLRNGKDLSKQLNLSRLFPHL